MSDRVTHGACGKAWQQAGNETSHCGGCHETFVSLGTFDAHRTKMRCNPPDLVLFRGHHLFQRGDGQWFSPTAAATMRQAMHSKHTAAANALEVESHR